MQDGTNRALPPHVLSAIPKTDQATTQTPPESPAHAGDGHKPPAAVAGIRSLLRHRKKSVPKAKRASIAPEVLVHQAITHWRGVEGIEEIVPLFSAMLQEYVVASDVERYFTKPAETFMHSERKRLQSAELSLDEQRIVTDVLGRFLQQNGSKSAPGATRLEDVALAKSLQAVGIDKIKRVLGQKAPVGRVISVCRFAKQLSFEVLTQSRPFSYPAVLSERGAKYQGQVQMAWAGLNRIDTRGLLDLNTIGRCIALLFDFPMPDALRKVTYPAFFGPVEWKKVGHSRERMKARIEGLRAEGSVVFASPWLRVMQAIKKLPLTVIEPATSLCRKVLRRHIKLIFDALPQYRGLFQSHEKLRVLLDPLLDRVKKDLMWNVLTEHEERQCFSLPSNDVLFVALTRHLDITPNHCRILGEQRKFTLEPIEQSGHGGGKASF